MNKKIELLLKQVNSDEEKYKIILIEDIIRAYKFLFGTGNSDYKTSVLVPEKVFDKLYDLPINDLQITEGLLADKCTKAMQIKLDLLKSIKHEN